MNGSPEQEQVADVQTHPSTATARVVSEGMERHLHHPKRVLDHGFVRVVDYMGDDAAIVQAARVSYGTSTKRTRGDAGLIRYLMRHRHTTPFEMCEVKFHVKLPIFVARQWIRHRTANVNEYSARYSVLDREFYVPSPEHLAAQSNTNQQGRGEVIEGGEADEVLRILKSDSLKAYSSYEFMLSSNEEKRGLSRELARINLPVSIYTQWYWKTDLHNLFHFVALRGDKHSQYEIRAYADVMAAILADWVPVAWQAFSDYRVNGFELSAVGVNCVRRLLKGEKVTMESSGMTRREWLEFEHAILKD
ncbi:MAG: FAD-dependent thymidylate synthase [Albidovulum sp.]|nr:FAD-dependent thymidylate synthase [Albidovulum sp.]